MAVSASAQVASSHVTTQRASAPPGVIAAGTPSPAIAETNVADDKPPNEDAPRTQLSINSQVDSITAVSKVDQLRNATYAGDPDAPTTLANLYLEGKEGPPDCDQAMKVLTTAAAKRNVRARNRLAALYAVGTCVQRDRVKAYHWLVLALAVDPHDLWAQRNRDLTWRQMTPDEKDMAEAQ